MTSPHPYSRVSLEEVTARSEAARHVIAGLSAQMPALAGFWRYLDTALADNLTLCAEVSRLSAELAAARLDRANLLAAQIDHSLSDVSVLTSEITRLQSELQVGRLGRANLAAAGRATLAADRDGELDPLSYLRDELTAQGFIPSGQAIGDHPNTADHRGRSDG
jgi:hypothetical protein